MPQAERYMQGIAVPESAVRPEEFFAKTRRRNGTEYNRTFAGLGQQDVVDIRKSDILSKLLIRFKGQLTVAPGGGAVATTRRWPYDLLKMVRFNANGQSNLIQVSGLKLKVHEFMRHQELTDRGVSRPIGGANSTTLVQQGTLSQNNESWGVGSGTTGIAAGTYDVDLEWIVPISEDDQMLLGAIFCATSSTDLNLTLDWATPADLFVLSGGGTASLAGQVTVAGTRFSIPVSGDGQIVVPDLSTFHSLIQTRKTDLAIGAGNEARLVGQGAGKTLLRLYSQLWNGSTPAPLPVNDSNYGRLAWVFSGNETPDEYASGAILRMMNERYYNCDIGSQWGFFAHDFAVENAFRDTVDLGTTSELRQVIAIDPSVTLTNPALEVVAETIFVAGV